MELIITIIVLLLAFIPMLYRINKRLHKLEQNLGNIHEIYKYRKED